MNVGAPNPEIAKAALRDGSRPTLAQPWIRATGDNGRRTVELCASDSFMLVRVPLGETDEEIQDGPLPAEVLEFAAARKASVSVEGDRFLVRDHLDQEIASFPRPFPIGKYPDVDALMPSGEPLAVFGLNAKYLARLAEALGSDCLQITVYDPLKPIHVEPTSGRGSEGLLMPVKVKT